MRLSAFDRFVLVLICLLSVFFLAVLSAMVLGVVLNRTPSVPTGFYRATGNDPKVGDLVTVCVPARVAAFGVARGYFDRGGCPSGVLPLVKRLVAVEGDRFEVSDDGVRVSGRLLANSAPLRVDGRGRALPRLRGAASVPRGSVLVMSEFSAESFDSRYFGPVERPSDMRAIRPMFLFQDR